ncbi:MAG: UvrD-helicase domain-containing protein, partial [Deltaproteobacteria bacterium]|nr:UvrD-helicase domain-containing protein [Deltaproteobacteria bacterium]
MGAGPQNEMNQPPDYEDRELALDVTQSHHVEAPAGSGKTMLLVARFIKLLSRVGHPHEILALTFTNKAAGEMKTRVVALLQKADRGLSATNDLEAGLVEQAKAALKRHEDHRHLLLSPEGLQVMTFHGFCYTLIKRAPLDAAIPPESVVLDEEDQERLLDQSIREMIQGVIAMGEGTSTRRAFENRLMRLNNRLPALADELKDLVKKRDLFSDLTAALSRHPDLDDFEAALTRRFGGVVETHIREAAEAFEGTFLGQDWSGLWHHLSEKDAPNARTLPETLPGTGWENLPAWKAISDVLTTKTGSPRRQLGPSRGGYYKGFGTSPWKNLVTGLPLDVGRLLSDLRLLPGPDESLVDTEAIADLIVLVGLAVETLEKNCRSRHVLDFVGLEQAALRTLAEDRPSDLQLFLDHQIQHILVDEFQDTSRSQWTLLKRLCAGWTPGDGRTLFVVGDPKQSVYAFRKAEVQLFLEAKKGLPLSGQGLLPMANSRLQANFRSEAPLVEWTNRFFGQTVMANPNPALGEVPFQPSTAMPRNADSSTTALVSLDIFFKDGTVFSPEGAEAEWMARKVRSMVDEGSHGASIGILLFARTRLRLYLNALRKNGVAVRVKQGLKIAEQLEVIHLYQMAAALCRPHDDLAWASLLRSPWSWLDANLLLKINRLNPKTWSRKLKLAAEMYPEADRLQRALELARQRVARDALGQVVRDLWMALDGPEKTAASFGAEGVANCRLFLDVLESIEKGIPEETLARLDSALDTLYAPESPEAAGAPVDLMTVHGAKGLEFDMVFLPFLDWRPLAAGRQQPYLLERSPEPPGLPLIAMGSDQRLGQTDKGYRLLKNLADGRRLGEAKRVLYVGATRARKALFLSGVARNVEGRPRAAKDTSLAWLLEHVGKHGENLIEVNLNPTVQAAHKGTAPKKKPLPHPASFEGQPLPYVVEVPSKLSSVYKPPEDETPSETEKAEYGAIRGTVTHRLIETLWYEG